MLGFDKAYALRGNPFSLANALPLEVRNDLRDGLEAVPLRMALEPLLLPYYSDAVYPKRKSLPSTRSPFQAFEQMMRNRGYSDNPKAVDPNDTSRLVLIRGPRGTGKTTLAHRMMRWLMDCDPITNRWKDIYWSANSAMPNALAQSVSITNDFKGEVLRKGSGRFLCLLDDVLLGADSEIFRVYSSLLQERVLFFFVTSDDHDILAKKYTLSEPPVVVYETNILTPEQAVTYCAERMMTLRTTEKPAWIADYPLFPFTQDIIQRSLSPAGHMLWDVPGSVPLRELNRIFSGLLEDNTGNLAHAFDINQITAGDVFKHLIDPVIVAERAA